MKTLFRLFALCSLLFAATAHAQWQSTTYTLKGGWNSIYLHGDATQVTPDVLFAGHSEILEVWRWNPNPNQVQFTTTPLLPSPGTPEWLVWTAGNDTPAGIMTGQSAFLFKCSGTTANTYTVTIPQRPLPPSASWVRNGANLLGFPTLKDGGNFPTFSNYFATFAAAIAANTKIFKYVGGDLGPANPIQVFSPALEKLDRNTAYWFSAEVVGNFYAPLEVNLSVTEGLAFGRTGSVITAYVRNRTSAPVTLTLDPVDSEPRPDVGQTGITGPVPLTRRVFNTSTAGWDSVDITEAYTEVIGPQSTVELSFGINRTAMAGVAVDAFFASFLRLRDSSNLMDIYLPATAQKGSLAGLWVGDIQLTSVASNVSNSAQATATVTDGVITAIEVVGTGGYGYLGNLAEGDISIAPPPEVVQAEASAANDGDVLTSITVTNRGAGYTTAPTVTIAPPPSGTTATATATVADGVITGISIDSGGAGSGYTSNPSVTIAAPPAPVPATATATVENGSVKTFNLTSGGSGYQIATPKVTVAPPPPLAGTSTPRAMPLRTLLHVADNGTARLLHQVFLGQLAAAPHAVGLCSSESLLKQDAKATAQRLVAAHMPITLPIIASPGSVAVPGSLTCTITVPFDDKTNPFVHQYHPDHDNKNERFQPALAGVESYNIEREVTFTFTNTPPPGSASSSGWGSTVIGGTYTEVITGLHKTPIQMGGTFELRRASEDGTLVTQ